MYICTQLIPLAIKQPFHESTTGQVGPIQATVSQEYDRSVINFYRSCDYISYFP